MQDLFGKAIPATLTALCLMLQSAWAELPKRDLTVELRQVKDGEQDLALAPGGAYVVGTASRTADFAPQQVRVRNGEKASLQNNLSLPMQWVQKVESQSATLGTASASGSANASSNASGVTQAITTMESGQSFIVTPHWPGGKQAVKLEIEMQSSAVEERTGADLPPTARQRYSTTVSAPLSQWVTIATSGSESHVGTYSSSGTSNGRRLIQIRVTAN
jgi:hypothetical protein